MNANNVWSTPGMPLAPDAKSPIYITKKKRYAEGRAGSLLSCYLLSSAVPNAYFFNEDCTMGGL
jgi:hypothetical protein